MKNVIFVVGLFVLAIGAYYLGYVEGSEKGKNVTDDKYDSALIHVKEVMNESICKMQSMQEENYQMKAWIDSALNDSTFIGRFKAPYITQNN